MWRSAGFFSSMFYGSGRTICSPTKRQASRPLLHFDYEMLLDARTLERLANYALLRITRCGTSHLEQLVRPGATPVMSLTRVLVTDLASEASSVIPKSAWHFPKDIP